MGALPKRKRNGHWINFEPRPPSCFVTLLVELTMMETTNRNRELIADFSSQRSRLGEAKMVRVRRLAAAHDARLLGHEFEVVLVAQPNGLAARVEVTAGVRGGG